MTGMTYQEKSLWAILVAEVAGYGYYFARMTNTSSDYWRLHIVIVLFVVAQIVMQTVIAVTSRNRVKDERDHAITQRGYRAAYFAFVTVLLLAMVFFRLHGTTPVAKSINVIVAVLVIAEVVKLVTQLASYRVWL